MWRQIYEGKRVRPRNDISGRRSQNDNAFQLFNSQDKTSDSKTLNWTTHTNLPSQQSEKGRTPSCDERPRKMTGVWCASTGRYAGKFGHRWRRTSWQAWKAEDKKFREGLENAGTGNFSTSLAKESQSTLRVHVRVRVALATQNVCT